jgi:hypothetical protein
MAETVEKNNKTYATKNTLGYFSSFPVLEKEFNFDLLRLLVRNGYAVSAKGFWFFVS